MTIKKTPHKRAVMAVLMTAVMAQFIPLNNASAGSPDRPNIVVIMADDMGYGDISCFGSPPYKTPHLDKLAAEGMKFTDFHSNGSVCSPTRAALLTGRYQQRAGIDGVVNADPKENRHHGLQMSEITFAEELGQAGYITAMFGKWHLGYEVQYNPTKSGFDEFRGYVSGNICYQSHLDRMGIEDWWHNDKLTPEEGYCTHLITKNTVEFIKQNKDRPFCVYVAHECVHSPFQGPNDPPVREAGKVGDIQSAKVKDVAQAYKEMMIEMDSGVGEIVSTLRELGIDKNTLVLFFSDNGAMKLGSNAPWKGFKGSLWEGGHRVPMIAWHPDHIPAGTVSETPSMTIDIMPTLLDLAKISASTERPLDGVSLVPELYEEKTLSPRTLYWSYRNNWVVRDGEWKLFVEKKGKRQTAYFQLFNLQDDPGEEINLAKKFPKRVQKMMEAYSEWITEIGQTATRQPDAP